MSTNRANGTRKHEFQEMELTGFPSEDRLVIDDLTKVRLALTADLGETTMTVREVLELRQGSVVPLSKLAGEMTDIYVNGVPLARGDVVVIADTLHVRIGEVHGVVLQDEKDVTEDEY